MRKFTKNFLLGGHRFGSVLRKIGLSMVALFWAALAFSQNTGQPQETYHVWAEEVTHCYQADNRYEAKVYFDDFIKIDTFVLALKYDATVFDYVGLTGTTHPVLAAKLKIVETTPGTLIITWDSQDDPVGKGSIYPDNTKTNVFTLQFKQDVYPLNCCGVWTSSPYCSTLVWDDTVTKYWNQFGQVVNILTDMTTDGSLCVKQDIALTNAFVQASCNGNLGTVTTTVTPAGTYYYSFNGTTYTTVNSSAIASPSFNNTVQVATKVGTETGVGNSCVSYIYTFDMPGPTALAWNKTALTINTRCFNGLADLEMLGLRTAGTVTTYYIVPASDWGPLQVNVQNSNGNLLPSYATTQSIAQLKPGTYYIALDDGCQKLNVWTADWSSKWKTVTVTDTNSKLMVTPTVTNLLCNGDFKNPAKVGIVSLAISGALPFKTPNPSYNVWFNNVYQGHQKSGWDIDSLAAGKYAVYVCDSVGCDTTFTVEVKQPAAITFDVGHYDASCKTITDPGLNGKIWIAAKATTPTVKGSSVYGGSAGTGTTPTLTGITWQWSNSPLYTNLSAPIAVTDTAKMLPSGVYYILLTDANGCKSKYVNAQTDNAVKLLTTEFTVTYPKVGCYGGLTDATINLTTGDGNHVICYGYVVGSSVVEPTTWYGSTCTSKTNPNKFTNLPAGVYTFWVWDKTIGCKTSMQIEITQPPRIVAEIVPYMTVPPTCPGNTDGALTVYVTGGRPWHDAKGNPIYEFKMDNKTWVKATNYNTFAIDTAPHTILVRDSAGCSPIFPLMFDLRNPFVNPFYWPIPAVSQLIAHRDYVNYIDFQDTIWNECPTDNVNLFNKSSINDAFYAVMENGWNWSSFVPQLGVNNPNAGGVALDLGYLKSFVWFGVPVEHFTGGAVTLNYAFWTSDSGWVHRSVQGVQQFRNPKLYITKTNPGTAPNPEDISQGWTIINHLSAYPAGVYYVVGMDEWGCVSNVDKIVIIDPKKPEYVVTQRDAGCDGATDGQIRIAAYNAKYPIPFDYRGGRYQYFLSQQPQIFSRPNWVNEGTWYPFRDDMDLNNDSVAAINVQDGKYWIAVRDYCGVKNPKLVQVLGPFTVKGFAAMKVDWTVAKKTDVTCNVWSATNQRCNTNPVDNGSIVIPESAVSGGDGTYSYKLDSVITYITLPVIGTSPIIYTSPSNYTGKYKWPKTGNIPMNITTLGAGKYQVTVYSKSGCQVVYPITIAEPEPLKAIVNVVNPSCYEDHDGILRYNITGGRHPFMEATNNIANGAWESAGNVPADRWVLVTPEEIKTSYTGVCDKTVSRYKFDRRVRFGTYEIFVKDSMGCIYGPIKVTVNQPAQLTLALKPIAVTCNSLNEQGNVSNGAIVVTPKGGWNNNTDGFNYYISLWKGALKLKERVLTQLPTLASPKDTIMFSNLPVGDYSVKIYEWNPAMATVATMTPTIPPVTVYPYNKPVTMYTYYFNDSAKWRNNSIFWGSNIVQPNNTFQNPDTMKCFTVANVTIGQPDPIVYDKINWNPATCYETHTGSIEVLNIRGGVQKKLEGYRIGLEGPADYKWNTSGIKETTTSGVAPNVRTIRWYATGKGTNGVINYKFNNLIHGHYTVHIKDSFSCWIYKESGEVTQPDTLKINLVVLKENAACNGGLGKVVVRASGGTPPYKFAVDHTLLPHPMSPSFPSTFDLAAYLNGLKWQAQPDSVISVPAATWIGYVMDANGCVTGYATYPNGNPVYHHRVVVTEPTKVMGYISGHVQPTCNPENGGIADGKILIGTANMTGIWGGNGGKWTARVTGKTSKGVDVDKTYPAFDLKNGKTYELTGLWASTDKTADFTAADKYKVTLMDKLGCSWDTMIAVTHPAPFKIVLKGKQDAFICYNDKAGVYEIQVVSGGTSFGTGPDGKPLYEFKWRAFKTQADLMIGTQAVAIDSLSDETYGFTPTFLGYAGLWYRAYGRDARGCETSRDTFIAQPNEIKFTATNQSCYGDAKAVVKVTIDSGNEGRQYKVWYQKETRTSPTSSTVDAWKEYNGLFTTDILIENLFDYDNENYTDIHYSIYVVDTKGCKSKTVVYTFDKVQHPLAIVPTITNNECNSTVKLNISGGTPPYVVKVDGAVVADPSANLTLAAGTHTVWVQDSRVRCTLTNTFTIAAFTPTTTEVALTTYYGEKVQYKNTEAGIDEMLGAGVKIYNYTYMGCPRVIKVTVTEVCPPVVAIKTVQGTTDVSPMVGKTVSLKGSITGVLVGEGFFMQDANAEWSGIWVATTSTVGCTLGCGVEVCGSVSEVANVTTINARSFTIVASPLTVSPIMVLPSEVAAEKYESVVVKVKGVRATAKNAATGEWTVYTTTTNNAIVNDLIYAYTPIAGDYYNVTGVVSAMANAYKIEPRVGGDIENLKLTSVTPVSGIEYKVYPNPFNDRIFIDNNDKLSRAVITNVAGQRVIDVVNPSHEIRTSNLVSGVYVITLLNDKGIVKTEKFIKE